jgi:ATP-dependent phosphoenolpyruvate carboxykinase
VRIILKPLQTGAINLPPSALYEHAIRYEKNASIAENGALVAYSGVKTGRSLRTSEL